ncbi:MULTISPECIES: energy transducer TonB [unclassified Stenotrophomonas]|uniref:energy transducer TonB family protein n=1 Tax=unclassified Stenotrophomonas TaxID=196198 RepID=UPI001F20F12B|nr:MULTISPECIES: energy transducer TonB [unclassified Stenotrophomonas]
MPSPLPSDRRAQTGARERRPHWMAVAITIGLHLLPVLGLLHWTTSTRQPTPPAEEVRISLRLLPPTAPPQPLEELNADRPSQAQQPRAPQPRPLSPPPPTRAPQGTLASGHGRSAEAQPLPEPVPALILPASDAAPAPASITAAPPTPDAPPAPQLAGAHSDSWEARLMARLERHRYFPSAARARRQQGTAWVRASVDRSGRLRTLLLERSSGEPMLDEAALQTFRRAQPLPRIPDDLPAPQERVVPVEYYLR